MKKITGPVVCVILSTLLTFTGCDDRSFLLKEEAVVTESGEETGDEFDDDGSSSKDDVIFVQVAGAVKSPGVFELPTGSRVMHAIDAAGGLKSDADDLELNQAEPLTDGQKIIVYTHKETKAAKEKQGETLSGESESGLVNINTADRSLLMTLPGVGATRADAIISYRQDNGRFSSKEDLKKVSGIGDGIFSGLSDFICL